MPPSAATIVQPSHAPIDFSALFREEAPFVGRTLRYLGVAEAQVPDACQEVFLVVHQKLATFVGGPIRAWIRQICVHVAQNQRRSIRRRREDTVDEPPEGVAEACQQETVEQRQLRDRLLALLDQLPAQQRAVFVLFELEELTMAETAIAVGCPLQTAYSRLHSARAGIRSAFASVGGEP